MISLFKKKKKRKRKNHEKVSENILSQSKKQINFKMKVIEVKIQKGKKKTTWELSQDIYFIRDIESRKKRINVKDLHGVKRTVVSYALLCSRE